MLPDQNAFKTDYERDDDTDNRERNTIYSEREKALLQIQLPITLTKLTGPGSSCSGPCRSQRRSDLTLARTAHLKRVFQKEFANSNHCSQAAEDIAMLIAKLEHRLELRVLTNGKKSRSTANQLSNLITVARSHDLVEWERMWASRSSEVRDLIDSERSSLEDGFVRQKQNSDESYAAAAVDFLRSPPEGWFKAAHGFPIEKPERVVGVLEQARSRAATRGRRPHYYEASVLRQMARWLSILSEKKVKQPSKVTGASERSGPLIKFLDQIKLVCGDEALFFGPLCSSGKRFECLGKGIYLTLN